MRIMKLFGAQSVQFTTERFWDTNLETDFVPEKSSQVRVELQGQVEEFVLIHRSP